MEQKQKNFSLSIWKNLISLIIEFYNGNVDKNDVSFLVDLISFADREFTVFSKAKQRDWKNLRRRTDNSRMKKRVSAWPEKEKTTRTNGLNYQKVEHFNRLK